MAMKMSSRPTGQPRPPMRERRAGPDRRAEDLGPPSRVERRRGMESRRPEVIELEMSRSEWEALNELLAPPPLPPASPVAEE